MESTEPVVPAANDISSATALDAAVRAVLALGPAAVPAAYSGPTIEGVVRELQRVANDLLVAHLRCGSDENVRAAFRVLRRSAEAVIEQTGPAPEFATAVEPGVDPRPAADPGLAAAAAPGVDAGCGQAESIDARTDAVADTPLADSEPAEPAEPAEDEPAEDEHAGAGSADDPGNSRVTSTAAECVTLALRQLWEMLAGDKETEVMATDYHVAEHAPGAAEQRWERFHLLCLRLATASAERWRQKAYELIDEILIENDHEPIEIVPAGNGLAIPALAELGYAGSSPLTSEGGLPSALADAARHLDGRWLTLARCAAVAYWLDEHDPLLYGGLAKIHTTTEQTLASPGFKSDRYRLALVDRIGDLAMERNARKALSRAVSVDEAIRGLVPIPFPVMDSWWYQFNDELRDLVFKQLPPSNFSPVTRVPFSSVRLDVDPNSPKIGPDLAHKYHLPAGVVWILRLRYADHIVADQRTGRVAYVSGS